MKKVIALAVMIGFLSINAVSYAYIDRRVDSFDGTVTTYSVWLELCDLAQLTLIKVNKKLEGVHFEIDIATDVLKKYDFSKDFAEIKINNIIYEMRVLKNQYYKDTDYGLYPISSNVQIPEEAIKPLKSAEKVALRFHRENGHQDVVELPDDVLAEWKEVINTIE